VCMSYSVVIEGTQGARKVRHGALPRQGEWLSLQLGGVWWWLPVLEVGYSLSEGKALQEPEEGCEVAHDDAESLVFTSLAVGVRTPVRFPEESVKLVLPPTRWPCGGRVREEIVGDGHRTPLPDMN
jgi:hypothetical protein